MDKSKKKEDRIRSGAVMKFSKLICFLDFFVGYCIWLQAGHFIPTSSVNDFLNVVFQVHVWPQFWQVGIGTPPGIHFLLLLDTKEELISCKNLGFYVESCRSGGSSFSNFTLLCKSGKSAGRNFNKSCKNCKTS